MITQSSCHRRPQGNPRHRNMNPEDTCLSCMFLANMAPSGGRRECPIYIAPACICTTVEHDHVAGVHNNADKFQISQKRCFDSRGSAGMSRSSKMDWPVGTADDVTEDENANPASSPCGSPHQLPYAVPKKPLPGIRHSPHGHDMRPP